MISENAPRADVVGSLLRPPELLEAAEKRARRRANGRRIQES